MGLVIEEFEPAPALRGVVRRAADFHERAAPLHRLESPLAGMVLIVSLGPDMYIDGRRTGSFVAGVWDRPTMTGHGGEQAGYQLYLDILGARRLFGGSAGELANRLVDLRDVFGAFAAELTERLADASDAEERHAVAQRLLAGRLAEDQATAPEWPTCSHACKPHAAQLASRPWPRRSAGAGGISPPASAMRSG